MHPDYAFTRYMVLEKKAAVLPMSGFYLNPEEYRDFANRKGINYVRVAICKSKEIIQEVNEKILDEMK